MITYSSNESIRIFFKPSQVCLIVCCLMLVGTFANAQAVKVNEFEGTSCEEQRSIVDSLLSELKESPTAKGVIVIHRDEHNPVAAYMERSTISDHLRLRKFDTNRIVFVLGKSESNLTTEFWKAGEVELDRFGGPVWDFRLANQRTPFIAYAESWIQGTNCGFYAPDLSFIPSFSLPTQT